MARSKSPKTNGVKEAVPATDTRQTDNPQSAEAASSSATKAESMTRTEPRKATAPKSPVSKLEAVKTEYRGNVVPINLEDEIRRLAYLLSERRGFEPGHENEDWLAAEHEVLQRYRQQSA
jgi:hypothetical protein